MSADNGIYILATNDGEIRVAHAQAIENIGYGKTALDLANIVLYFKDSKVYTDSSKAWEKAKKIYDDVEYAEYGICNIELDIPFPNITPQRAMAIIEDYYEAVQLEQRLNRVFNVKH